MTRWQSCRQDAKQQVAQKTRTVQRWRVSRQVAQTFSAAILGSRRPDSSLGSISILYAQHAVVIAMACRGLPVASGAEGHDNRRRRGRGAAIVSHIKVSVLISLRI